jgi:hypothetical protein
MNLYQPTITGSLSVSGSVNISGSINIAGGGTISGTASIATTALTASSADNLLVRNTLTAQTLVVQTITSSVDFVTGSTQFGSLLTNTHVFSGSISMNPGGLFVSSSGLVGIGTTSPQSILDIRSANLPRVQLVKTGIISWYLGDTQQDGTNTFSIGTDSGANYRVLNILNTGNVGIGTTSPSDYIDAGLGLAIISTSGRTGLSIGSTQGTANEVLGRLSFTNTNSTNIGSKRLAYISGIRGTSDNSAYLEFGTANDGLGAQRMVISQAGSVGIGISSPRASLQVSNSTEGIATIPSLGQSGSYTSLYLTNLNPSYGLLMGSINNGNSWIQVQRTDGSATAYDLQLQPNGGSVNVGSTLITPRQLGKSFSQTSGGGTGTSIIDTGITYNTGDFGGYGRGVTYQVVYNANPNAGGSAGYFAQHVGILIVYTGYNGSAVTTYIQYTQLAVGNNIGGLTLTPVFWNGSSEVSTVGVYTTGYQIRLKISGYNSSFTGADQSVFLTRLM